MKKLLCGLLAMASVSSFAEVVTLKGFLNVGGGSVPVDSTFNSTDGKSYALGLTNKDYRSIEKQISKKCGDNGAEDGCEVKVDTKKGNFGIDNIAITKLILVKKLK